jgi:ADP-ribosyl-[dinitrogen reductase] hydrolase
MIEKKLEACIIAGAIGDAWGSSYEQEIKVDYSKTYSIQPIVPKQRVWAITDDTQLTLASCEALCHSVNFDPTILCGYFVKYYKERKLTGMGASTLKAMIELESDMHWSQVGRTGEYAAGNGAAMRIAPFAFFKNITKEDIRTITRITHKNDEAYTGALAVVLSIRAILRKDWWGNQPLFDIVIPQLPDTQVRDRMIAIAAKGKAASIADIAAFGTDGYVVNSVPFAIFAATQIQQLGLEKMLKAIIDAGGDTDTNASIAGQIAGTLIGVEQIPATLLNQLKALPEYNWIKEIVDNTKRKLVSEKA